ncbi:MAG TPA: protein kinase [Candidatus Krumholzibacteria bacterium]|nr:protein kinase [Candidatus Krumholzibacteria bacterium]
MTLIGSKILHYRILEEIGAGGMGVVYLAEDEKLHRRVALKFVGREIQNDPDARDRLIREARAASRLTHPNIVAIHAIEETPEHTFIVMEYVEGESARSLAKRGEITWQRALELAPQILSALATAHEHDVVHRDIKSDNILITAKGQPKVLDFGLARGRDTSAFVTRVGSSAGTPAYMSPEQVQEGEVDQRTDLFSFGVVFYEMITGRMPFKGEHESAVTYSIVNEPPTPIRTCNKAVPEDLQRIVSRFLEKNPRDRYQSAAEAIEDLQKFAGGRHIARLGRLPLRVMTMGGAALAVLLIGGWLLKSGRAPMDPPLVPDANAGRKMLAVLPFENLGPTDQEYFADGVTEEITTQLAKLSGLGVISRTSTMKYKGSQKSLRAIGKELGVDYALEGSVRWEKSANANNVRISVQLIRINDDTHLWADNFDRVYDQIFTIQSEIAARVADELNITLLEPERAAIAAAPTNNMDAYDLYMRGRASYDGAMDSDDRDGAMRLVESAVDLDSTYAEAQAFLARQYANQYFNGLHPELPRLKQARQAALAAMRHSGDLPAGHIAMGYYHYYGSRDYARALQEFDIARKMQPNNAEVLAATAYVQRRQGRWDESTANLERAIALDPTTTDRIGNLIQTLAYMREWGEAKRYVTRGLAIDPSSLQFQALDAMVRILGDGDVAACRARLAPIAEQHASILNLLVQCDFLARDYAAVEKHMPNLSSVAGGDTTQFYTSRAMAYHFAGDDARARVYADSAVAFMDMKNYANSKNPTDVAAYADGLAMAARKREALETIDRAVAMMPIDRDAMTGSDLRNARAIVYVVTGEYELAIRELQFLLSVPSGFSPAILRLHPGFDPLRSDPRFQRMVEEKLSS